MAILFAAAGLLFVGSVGTLFIRAKRRERRVAHARAASAAPNPNLDVDPDEGLSEKELEEKYRDELPTPLRKYVLNLFLLNLGVLFFLRGFCGLFFITVEVENGLYPWLSAIGFILLIDFSLLGAKHRKLSKKK